MNVTVTPLDSDAIAAKARDMLQKGQAKESR